MSYCVKEKKITKNRGSPTIVLTKNGRRMERSICDSCGITKTKFIPMKKGGLFDVHKAMLPILPKKGLTLPGYKYCGPGNPLENGAPVNSLDEVCMEHDFCYDSGVGKSECDKKMLSKLKNSQSKTLGEKIAKHLIVKPVIATKHKLGLGNSKNGRRGSKWSPQ